MNFAKCESVNCVNVPDPIEEYYNTLMESLRIFDEKFSLMKFIDDLRETIAKQGNM